MTSRVTSYYQQDRDYQSHYEEEDCSEPSTVKYQAKRTSSGSRTVWYFKKMFYK